MGQIVGGVKGGIARVGRAAGEGGFQIDHRVVRRFHIGLGGGHDPGVVIPLPVPGVVGDRHMAHGVAADRQGGHSRLRGRGVPRNRGVFKSCGDRDCGFFLGRREAGGRCSGGNAAGAQQQGQAEQEGGKLPFHGRTSLFKKSMEAGWGGSSRFSGASGLIIELFPRSVNERPLRRTPCPGGAVPAAFFKG